MKLIINADDFGYSRGINHGIIDSYKYGVLTSATMMMNMPGTEHAVQLAKEHPGLGVGVHLVLTTRKPLHRDVPSLISHDGIFKTRKEVFDFTSINIEDIEKEWTEQIEKLLSFGLKPSHLDSHHFVHSHPQISPVLFKLAEKYQIPARNHFLVEKPPSIRTTDVFIDKFHKDGITLKTFFELTLYKNQTVEVMAHPGYLDEEILNHSSYSFPRTKEVVILTSMELMSWIEKEQVKLINFNHI
ncbi:chitin disaccharide deacetylase [Bacillus sp. FJAT-45350]|uniref:chitin disaccharide deacetylase n=1 Tax=Bacillus sp. FJAT-45350 TaxID=2011014 RepID=UPI000BB694D2|nr:chitin disaccharide deacetylase [Bacillus sp. FJAT-45350]